MTTLIQELPRRIERLEAKFGSDDPFVKDLKRQYAAMKETDGKTTQDVYLMSAVKFPAQATPLKACRKE